MKKENTPKTSRKKPMARVNTRIRLDQQKYIKGLAKKFNSTEGEIFRAIIDDNIKNNKK